MKVVVLKDDKRYGKKGNIIDVNDGFAKNFLIPQGIVAVANNTNINEANQLKSSQQFKADTLLNEAKDLAKKIEDIQIEVKVKVGDTGKVFGSVTSKEIGDELSQLNIDIDKRKIDISSPLKSIGLHVVNIKLHPNVVAKLKVNVVS